MLFPIEAIHWGNLGWTWTKQKRFKLQAVARRKRFHFNLKTLSSIHIQISFEFSNLDSIFGLHFYIYLPTILRSRQHQLLKISSGITLSLIHLSVKSFRISFPSRSMIYYFGIAEHPISSGDASNTNCLIHPSSLQVLIHLNRYRDPKLQSLRVRRTGLIR
jgi:hypothetical protein